MSLGLALITRFCLLWSGFFFTSIKMQREPKPRYYTSTSVSGLTIRFHGLLHMTKATKRPQLTKMLEQWIRCREVPQWFRLQNVSWWWQTQTSNWDLERKRRKITLSVRECILQPVALIDSAIPQKYNKRALLCKLGLHNLWCTKLSAASQPYLELHQGRDNSFIFCCLHKTGG